MAAQKYDYLGNLTHGSQQAQLYSHAMRIYYQINKIDQAKTILTKIDKKLLSHTQLLNLTIIEAKITLFSAQAELALNILTIYKLKYSSPFQQQAAYKIKIQAYKITKNWRIKKNKCI